MAKPLPKPVSAAFPVPAPENQSTKSIFGRDPLNWLRLRFLYAELGFTKQEIAKFLAVPTRAVSRQIESSRLRKWQGVLKRVDQHALGVIACLLGDARAAQRIVEYEFYRPRYALVSEIRQSLREMAEEGTVDWNRVDAVAAVVREYERLGKMVRRAEAVAKEGPAAV